MLSLPRRWLARLAGVFRASRTLSLGLGFALGIGALFAAEYYAHLSLYQYLLLPLGVGGSTYYMAHYDLSAWSQDAMLRGFIRNFAMLLPLTMLISDDLPLMEYIVSFVAVYGAVFLAVITAVVDVVDATDDEDADDGDHGVEGGTHRRPASAVDAD
ncbi:hypothetical protein [Halorubellus litoreus]|uniref:Uncharacterized protein n=1 Tax=Halorubellus litoreus TaxID=755308 RepID=A0ABD5VLE3_9EURY